ncbi:GNAT family N-acetyltransferase [Derxia lacustris]|uniref:GNAT family N-acetyltransferase n=1 Tax=Derxia lacustris TaxID=764842 RepID=UPI00111C342E|nr:GNAT family N-acetyltransferase [Derxia lacustris]
MSAGLCVVDLHDADGRFTGAGWLERAWPVHRQLRPHLDELAAYVQRIEAVTAGGARMALAVDDGDAVLGVAVYRWFANTHDGLRFYVDDLVTDEARRSAGVGHLLLDWLRHRAVALGCDSFTLESGTQRQQAHKFYFREGMAIPSFSFKAALKTS